MGQSQNAEKEKLKRRLFIWRDQCDQIGRFLKVLGDNLSFKSLVTFEVFWNRHFLSKNCHGYFFGRLYKKLGNFFIYYLLTLVGISQFGRHSLFIRLIQTLIFNIFPNKDQSTSMSMYLPTFGAYCCCWKVGNFKVPFSANPHNLRLIRKTIFDNICKHE